MNIHEYIESGILEAYVLDALSQEEHAEVANNVALYPELATEVKAIEERMFAIAQQDAVAPPDYLQDQIWNTIVHQSNAAPNQTFEENEHKIIALPPTVEKPMWQRAAVWAALLVSVLTNFILLSQRNTISYNQEIATKQLDSIKQQQIILALALENYAKEKDMLADTAIQAVLMKTALPGHPMAATIYWSKANGDVYLAMQKLPMPPSGMQYQMWYIQDGKPVSMGVIPNEMIATGAVKKLPMQVMASQAFAISLEKEGGSPTPTSVQVVGKV